MSLRARFLKGGVDLTLGFAGQQALTFLRNVLIARLIGPENFGIAVTFAIVLSVLELLSDVGTEQFLIRSPDGEDPALQNALQGFAVLRGIAIGLGIFLLADISARLFSIPDVAWAYRLLALVPIIKGFTHLDMRRFQRRMAYRPSIYVALGGVTAGFVVAVGLAITLRSYEAMLWATLVEITTTVVCSHLVAERPYRIALASPALGRLFAYGWPLLLNGAVLFAMGQGDRIVVGSLLSIHGLAIYAAAGALASGPSLLVMRVTGSLYVPMLSSHPRKSSAYVKRYQLCGALTAIAAFAITAPLIIIGPHLVEAIYGSEYKSPALLTAFLGISAGARVLRSWPIAAALATGTTKDILYANVTRIIGLGLCFIAVNLGFGVVGVAASMTCGELLACFLLMLRADSYSSKALRTGLLFFVAFLILSGLAMVLRASDVGGGLFQGLLAAGFVFAAGSLYVVNATPDLREYGRQIFGKLIGWPMRKSS